LSTEIVRRPDANAFTEVDGSIRQRPLSRGRAGVGGVVDQGKLHRDDPGTEESSPSPLMPGGPPLEGNGRYVQPRGDRRKREWMLEQSYDLIVPVKVGNRRAPARGGHGSHWREGGNRRTNLSKGDITRHGTRKLMYTDIARIAELAKEDPKRKFFSIAHLVTVEKLQEAFRSLRKDASAGSDGVTYQQYEANADENIRQLHQRLKEGKYQVQPLRRV